MFEPDKLRMKSSGPMQVCGSCTYRVCCPIYIITTPALRCGSNSEGDSPIEQL